MKTFLRLALLLQFFTACSPSERQTGKITTISHGPSLVQSELVTDADPVSRSTVGLLFRGQSPDENLQPSLCTATLIAPQVAVTAAHCVSVFQEAHVVLSRNFQNLQPENLRRITKVAIHPQYYLDQPEGRTESPSSTDQSLHDIALVFFEGPLEPTFSPAPLLSESSQLLPGQSCVFAGFGLTSPEGAHSASPDKGTLRKASMTLSSLEKIKGDLFFAPNPEGHSICQGDSGGPVYVQVEDQLHLAGVISRGENDSCKSFSIATGIPAHRPWIEKIFQKWKVLF